MNKQSWQQQECRLDEPSPLIDELLDDYFAAEVALKLETGPVSFRGQPVTRKRLITRLREETLRYGIDEDEMGVAFTRRWNTF